MEDHTLSWFVNDIKKINKTAKKRSKKTLAVHRWICQHCNKDTKDRIKADELPYSPYCWHCRQFQYDASGNIIRYHNMDKISWSQMGMLRDIAADGGDGFQGIGKINGIKPDLVEDWYNMPRGALGKRSGFSITDKQKKKVRESWDKSLI